MVDSLLNRKKSQTDGESGAQLPPRPEPLRRRAPNTLVRSILLGVVAVSFAIYWLGRSYAVDWADIRLYLLTSVLFVGAFIAAAATLWVLVRVVPALIRRVLHGKDNDA
jgi:apolipoprotein N-acyltransferase